MQRNAENACVNAPLMQLFLFDLFILKAYVHNKGSADKVKSELYCPFKTSRTGISWFVIGTSGHLGSPRRKFLL